MNKAERKAFKGPRPEGSKLQDGMKEICNGEVGNLRGIATAIKEPRRLISTAGLTQWWATNQACRCSLKKELRVFLTTSSLPQTAFMSMDSSGDPESFMDSQAMGRGQGSGKHQVAVLRPNRE